MHGLIISTGSIDNGQYRYQVLELETPEGEDPSIVRYVHESAFRVASSIVELAERKNLQRRLDVPLLFGDMVSWNNEDLTDDSVKAITSFTRLKALYRTRAVDNGCQILLRGAINPDDRLHIVTNIFSKLRLPVDQVYVGLPNVFYDCWVEIQPDYNGFSVRFAGLASVCDVCEQEDLITLPWNLTNDNYVLKMSMNSDSDDGVSGFGTSKGPVLELHGKNSFVSRPRTFFCSEHPNKMFVIPILKKNDPAGVLGTSLKIDAIWNRFENLYMVCRVQPQLAVPNWPVIQNRIKCTVHSTFTPGLFHNDDLGFIDDPDGKLALLHLTSYVNSGFQVTVVDSMPSKAADGKFRFRIVDLAPTAKECRIQKFLKNSVEKNKPIIVTNETGIVISKTHIFSAKHAPLLFKLPSDEEANPGLTVKFTAEYDHNSGDFIVSEVSYLPQEGLRYCVRRMLKHSPYEEQFLFQVSKARLPDRKDLPLLLFCEQFGYLDDLGLVKEPRRNIDYSVWIMYSQTDYQDAFRPARVPWEIVAIGGDEEPTNRAIDENTTLMENIPEMKPEEVEVKKVEPKVEEPKAPPPRKNRFDKPAPAPEGFKRKPEPTLPRAVASLDKETKKSDEFSSAEESDVEASLAVEVSENRNITVESIIEELNKFPHSAGCTAVCERECPFIKELSTHICTSVNFWEDCRKLYPDVATAIKKRMGG